MDDDADANGANDDDEVVVHRDATAGQHEDDRNGVNDDDDDDGTHSPQSMGRTTDDEVDDQDYMQQVAQLQAAEQARDRTRAVKGTK